MQDRADPIVSSESEELILVDEHDREIGTASKSHCHDGSGVLHRAFSVFLFDEAGRLLLQQRAPGKRLWPGYWSNSCCSHPRKDEDMGVATERRVRQELGVAIRDLEFIYKFSYQVQFRDLGAENELCWVYLGRLASPVRPNATEISAIDFIAPVALDEALSAGADDYTPWFRMEWQRLRGEFAPALARYTAD